MHLPLHDLRVDPVAAVVDRRVVDDLVDARLRVDLERARVDLGRIGQCQIAVFPLEVRLLELRPVDMADVQRDVELGWEPRVVRVQDRPERHERERGFRIALDPRLALDELDVVRRATEHGRGELLHLPRKLVRRALDGAEARDGELRGVGP